MHVVITFAFRARRETNFLQQCKSFVIVVAHMTTIALIQMRCNADTGKNLTTALARIEQAAKRGAQIVCLPELFRSLYFCQTEDHDNFRLAESIPGPSTEALSKMAQRLKI